MRVLALFVFFGVGGLFSKPPEETPRFEDFPSLRTAPVKVVPPKFNVRGRAWPEGDPKFKEQVELQTAKGANFAGAFVLAKISCGVDCVYIAVVDLETGAVWSKMPFFALLGEDVRDGRSAESEPLLFRADSRLLVARGCFDSTSGPNEGYWATNYYEWRADHFHLLRSVRRGR